MIIEPFLSTLGEDRAKALRHFITSLSSAARKVTDDQQSILAKFARTAYYPEQSFSRTAIAHLMSTHEKELSQNIGAHSTHKMHQVCKQD